MSVSKKCCGCGVESGVLVGCAGGVSQVIRQADEGGGKLKGLWAWRKPAASRCCCVQSADVTSLVGPPFLLSNVTIHLLRNAKSTQNTAMTRCFTGKHVGDTCLFGISYRFYTLHEINEIRNSQGTRQHEIGLDSTAIISEGCGARETGYGRPRLYTLHTQRRKLQF